MKKKKIIIGVVLLVAMLAVSAPYIQSAYTKYQHEQEIAYYNNPENFKAYAVEGVEDFKLEDYFVTAPNYNNSKEMAEKLEKDLRNIFYDAADYRPVIYTLLKAGMHFYTRNGTWFWVYTKTINADKLAKNQWHRFRISFVYVEETKLLRDMEVNLYVGESEYRVGEVLW